MCDNINHEKMAEMLGCAVKKIQDNHEHLSKLDSVVGDGDHGTTMLRVANTIEEIIRDFQGNEINSFLTDIGWSIMAVDGGSAGPLMGSFFAGMGEAAEESDSVNSGDLSAMFTSGLAKMKKLSKANVGDKTMLDALAPAVHKFSKCVSDGQNICKGLELAAEAAASGAESTKQMQAKFGRARNLGDRTIGHIDPGAMSIAYIFAGFRGAFSKT